VAARGVGEAGSLGLGSRHLGGQNLHIEELQQIVWWVFILLYG